MAKRPPVAYHLSPAKLRELPHHHGRTFQDEYRALLDEHGVDFDERYLW